MDVDSEIKKLGALGVAAALWQECGKGIIHLPRFGFAAGGAEHDMDLLLYPHARDGHETLLPAPAQYRPGQELESSRHL